MKTFIEIALALGLTGLAGLGLALLAGDRPMLLGAGLTLAAATPLGFLLATRIRRPAEQHHPVMISVGCGFGCVLVMFGVHRFGDQHQWILGLALSALIAWMLYQRYLWQSRQGR